MIEFVSVIFDEPGDFTAFRRAEAFLHANDFSVGPMQGPQPIGVMWGDFAVSKWRGMTQKERARLHGQLTGDKRNGPVTLTIFPNAPQAAREAIAKANLP